MSIKPKKQTGFTIVELLVVVVVIAILAAISVVAYTGIQERAKNAQTVSAVSQWVKALQLYKVDNGSYPQGGSTSACLGTGYGMGFSGSESSGFHCRQDTSGSGLTMNATFMNLMSDYISGNPTPAFATAGASTYPWYRGAYYYSVSGAERVDFVMAGSATPCPDISGLTVSAGAADTANNSRRCTGPLAQ